MKTNIRKYVNINHFYSSFALDHLIMLNPQIKYHKGRQFIYILIHEKIEKVFGEAIKKIAD